MRTLLLALMMALTLRAEVPYDHICDETAAAVLALAALPVEREPLATLKAAQARMERSVVQLIVAHPPLERLPDHLFLLPALQEVAAASRAVVDAREAGDGAALERSSDWYEQALESLAKAARKLSVRKRP